MVHVIPAHQARPVDDPIFALNREALARKAKGEPIINATVGALLDDDGRLAILPTASRAVKEVPPEEWAAYAPIAGTPDFLRAVVDDFLASQPALHACGVAQATPGGTGALRHAIANYLEPGQSLLTTSFYWGPYQTLADEGERRVATFSMFAPDGTFDAEALDRALTVQIAAEGRALVLLNDPCHNPTGYSMRPAEWAEVVTRLLVHADRAPVTLLVDVAYYAYGAGEQTAFLRELTPLLGRVGLLFAWSASKSYTHYGLRVGALIACVPDETERKMTEAAFSYSSRGTWSNCSRGGLKAITRLLTDPDLARACDRERGELKTVLRTRVAAFNSLAPSRHLHYPRYEGGFFVTVFSDDAEAKAARMRTRGVYVVPSGGALRVGLCSVAARDVERLVDALK